MGNDRRNYKQESKTNKSSRKPSNHDKNIPDLTRSYKMLTHKGLEMQLVRVPKLLECLMLRGTDAGGTPSSDLSCVEGLQDSLGRCRFPEKSLLTTCLTSGSWSSSRQGPCSEESQCLWTGHKSRRMKDMRSVWF